MRELFKRFDRRQTAVILVAAVCIAILTGASFLFSARDDGAAPRAVVIPKGIGAAGIARTLQREGVIRHWIGFSAYVALTNRAHELQAGTYLLCPCDPVPVIAGMIAAGEALSDDVMVTVPEGVNAWELDRIFHSAGLLARTGQFSRVAGSAEGSLFPETYRFAKDATVSDIVDRMKAEFGKRAGTLRRDELVIASMLEKEAKSAEDMALVAGIIRERMRRGMPLQIDATVAYGWCLRTVGYAGACDVTQAPIASELKIDGPYNTYTRAGLPAGPIANPGIQALSAAAHPKDSPYLYYLSTRDGSQLIYSKTLEEHLRNRAKYLGF
ncbi:MAG: endolytic transglycosylase MltG [Candidatus Yanofskybacteria bacterium]|nr:endolytic transglycosylase MltG [Candidatus Yanofskybacteria bacterium]